MERQFERQTCIVVPELTLLDLDDNLLERVAGKLTSSADSAALRLTHRRLEAAVALRISRLDRRTDAVYEIQRLAGKFPHLTHFDVPQHSKQLPWRELFTGLCSLKQLKSLNLGEWESQKVVDDLVKLPELRQLEVAFSGADAAQLRPLSRLTQLTAICLHDDFEGCDALDCLSAMIHLKELDLVWTGCLGNPLMAFPTGLTKLLLLSNVQDDECFGAGLSQLAHLQELSLGSEDTNFLTGRCLTALGRLAQLSSLILECHYDWKHGALAVLKDCLALRSLIISIVYVTADALSDLSLTPGLKVLRMAGVHALDVDYLSSLSTLTSICMGCGSADGMQVDLTRYSSMHFLQAMPDLQSFRIFRCKQVSDIALNSLSTLNHLARLELSYCIGVSPVFLMQLEAMTGLTHLNLSKNLWVQTDFVNVLTALTALVELDLSECRKLSERALQYLQGMANLKKLRLARNDWLGCMGLRSGLTGLGTLEVLNLDNCQKVTEVDLLYACERLRRLKLCRVRGLNLSASGRLRLQGPLGVCKVWPKFFTPEHKALPFENPFIHV